ncbi:glycosyl transferase [Methylovorus sp. MM2]|uniref:ArnT family glycosyltransferase n=1 Tax=Methylovorus sp. MM2 TaxID=1848038 RepID=UPI0007E21CA4|nr:glycosyl transferase [Methylovorus sp. MM2]OAM52303.1 glycosyl transferase [Methylovorus sp. MM2]
MAFELEHDWQGQLSTPRAKIGENAKTRLLIMLCIVWVCLGLIGHSPWKPDESQSISIIKSMAHGSGLLTPIAAGQTSIENPPLYYLSAAGFAKLLSPILPMHDAARIASGFWMAITLLMVGMLGRELWGKGTGRQTTFIFISSLGLVVSAHLLMPEVADLTGAAMGLYALALAKRRPFRASVLLGTGIGISFLSTGLISSLSIVATALLLPVLFTEWRSKSYAIVLGLSAIAATPWLLIWPALCWYFSPEAFTHWWYASWAQFNQFNHLYFIKTLAWFSWPALPLALWGLWRYRTNLLQKPRFQLLIIFFAINLIVIGFGADSREIFALPLLLPLAVLAGGSVETLKRGAAGALNWFGLILFGIIGFLIWLGWIAMLTNYPAKLAERMKVLSASQDTSVHWASLAAALIVTMIWLLVVVKAKRSNRAAVTDWAVGITMAWTLLMTLWLPWIDSAKSYAPVMAKIESTLPAHYTCIASNGLGSAQHALLHYHANLRAKAESAQQTRCDIYLIQDERGRNRLQLGDDWKLIWQGKRAADRRENFRLYQRTENTQTE